MFRFLGTDIYDTGQLSGLVRYFIPAHPIDLSYQASQQGESSMLTAYIQMWKRWKDTTGTTPRRQYWYAFFASLIVGLVLSLIGIRIIGLIYFFAVFVPMLNMTIRRLRDAGHPPHIAYVYGAGSLIFEILSIVNGPAVIIVTVSLIDLVVGIIALFLLVQRSVDTDSTRAF